MPNSVDNNAVDEEVIDQSQETEEIIEDETENTTEEPDEGTEVEISIDGESPPPVHESSTIKGMRNLIKKQNQKIKELETTSVKQEPKKEYELSPRPKWEDYEDELVFQKEEDNWINRKAQQIVELSKKEEANLQQQKVWQDRLDTVQVMKKELNIKDYDETEIIAQESLNIVQQGIIAHATDHPPKILYALGKRDDIREELSKISDPIKFAYELGKLETKMKLTPKTQTTTPEKVVKGSGGVSAVDRTLTRLEDEASRTGDRSKILEYKRKQRK